MAATLRRFLIVSSLGLVAVLSVGVSSALAHGGGGGGPGGHRGGPGGSISSALVTKAASELGVTSAALRTAIQAAATDAIDAAVEDGDLDADEAAEAKENVADSLRYAYSLTRASKVAAKVGKTTAQLNAAFKTARKAVILERIAEAVEDGELDEEDAAELKEELDDADLPGYKRSRFAFGFGLGG